VRLSSECFFIPSPSSRPGHLGTQLCLRWLRRRVGGGVVGSSATNAVVSALLLSNHDAAEVLASIRNQGAGIVDRVVSEVALANHDAAEVDTSIFHKVAGVPGYIVNEVALALRAGIPQSVLATSSSKHGYMGLTFCQSERRWWQH